jgi:hypothetical protein
MVAAARAYPTDTTLTPENVNAFRGIFLQLTRDTEEAHNALDLFLGDPERFPILTEVPAELGPASAAAKPAEPDAEPEA